MDLLDVLLGGQPIRGLFQANRLLVFPRPAPSKQQKKKPQPKSAPSTITKRSPSQKFTSTSSASPQHPLQGFTGKQKRSGLVKSRRRKELPSRTQNQEPRSAPRSLPRPTHANQQPLESLCDDVLPIPNFSLDSAESTHDTPTEEANDNILQRTLFDALIKGKLSLIRSILARRVLGCDIKKGFQTKPSNGFPNTLGWRPLHFAAWSNNTDVARLLLTYGENPDATNDWGQAPLHVCAVRGSVAVAEILLDNGASVDLPNATRHHQTALHIASITNQSQLAQLLIARGASPTTETTYEKNPVTPMAVATSCFSADVISVLLQFTRPTFANIDVALSSLARRGMRDALVNLVSCLTFGPEEKPALVRALYSAIEMEDRDIISFLCSKCSEYGVKFDRVIKSNTVLHLAVDKESEDILHELLLTDPTSLEVLDGAHHTPLYVAVMKQSTRIVEVLLRAGASPLLPQAPPFSYHLQKTTCIHALAQYGSKEIFDLITRISKAKIDLAHLIGHNKNGYTPLHLAATAGNSEMIECVLRFISDPAKAITMEDYMGAKPLHSACARGHLECVELLLAHGANVDDVNTAKGRWTPLHYAAAAGHDSVVRLLLSKGSSIDAETTEKKTALQIARQSGYTGTALLLKQSGATDTAVVERAFESGKVQLMVFGDTVPQAFQYKGVYTHSGYPPTSSSTSDPKQRTTKLATVPNSVKVVAKWRTARLFISSTFEDMHAERNYLLKNIIPRLKAECAKKHVHLIEIDLRWGVTAEESQTGRSIEVCLAQVDCCDIFTGLIGSRYGWSPTPNQVPDDIKVRYDWSDGLSITHMEIMRGALKKKNDPKHKASFYIRDSSLVGSIPQKQKMVFEETDQARRSKVDKLRRDVEDAKSKFPVFHYKPKFRGVDSDGKVELDGLDQLGEEFFQNVLSAVDSKFSDANDSELLEEWAIERSYHDEMIEYKTRNFVGRKDTIEAMDKHIHGRENTPLAVAGDPGSGKSALMAYFVRHAIANGSARLSVVSHFVGASAASTNPRSMLLRLTRQIITDMGLFTDLDESGDYDSIANSFKQAIDDAGKSRSSKLLIVIDAVNQLNAVNHAQELQWLPTQLPMNVKIVFSFTPESQPHSVAVARNYPVVAVGALSEADRQEIVSETLARYHKKLDSIQLRLLLEKMDTQKVLYLIIACEELRLYGVYEKVSRKIQQLPVGLYGLIDSVFTRLEGEHGTALVRDVLCLLQTSRHGLLESELVEMLNVASAKLSSLLLSLDLFLRKIGLDAQLDFFHRQFAKAVAKKYLSADSTSTHYHTWLAKYYQDKFQTTNSARAISELPFHLSGAKMVDELEATLCNLEYVQRKASLGLAFELVADFRDACNVAPSSTSIESFGKFIRSNISVIAAQPELVIQQALSSATSPPEVVASAKSLAAKSPKAKLIRWINRPESLNSSNSGHLTMMDAKTDVNDVAWSSDGSYVLSANRDGTVSIWSGQFGEELGRISGHSERVNGVAFGPSGQLFVSVAHDKKLNVYQTSSRQIIASWMAPAPLVSCSVRKLGNDELQIAVGSEDGKAHILLFDGASLTKDVQTLAKHRDVVSCVSFSPTGDYLLTGSGDKTLQLWASSGKNSAFKHIKQFSGHSKGVKDCSWNPTGGWFASSSQDRYIMTWSVTSPGNGPIASVMAHSDNVEAIHVAQLPDGQRVVVTGSWDRSVKLWNASPDGTKLTLLGSYAGTSHFVNTVEILSSCSKLAVGSPDHTIKIYAISSYSAPDTAAKKQDTLFQVHEKMIRGLAYNPAKRILATGSWDNTAKVMKLGTGPSPKLELKLTLAGHSKRLNSVVFNTTGTTLLTGSMDQLIKSWSTDTGHPLLSMSGHSKNVFALALSHDGRYIASASADYSVRIWDAESGAEIGKLDGHNDWACALAFSPFSRRLVSGGRDSLLKVWDTETGEELETLRGHKKCILQVRYSPDGRFIVSASEDKTVKIWDALSHQEVATLAGHNHEVTSVEFFKSHSNFIVTGSSDKTIRVWNVQDKSLVWTYYCDAGTIAVDTTEDDLILVGDSAGCVHVLSPTGLFY